MDISPTNSKRVPNRLLKLAFALTGVAGAIFIIAGIFVQYNKPRLVVDVETITIEEQTENVYKPKEVIIRELDLSLAIEESRVVNGVWEVSDERVSFLENSSAPGGGGNIVLYGHNKRDIFGRLGKLSAGSTITVINEVGDSYAYVVDEIKVVKPDDISVVQPTDHEVLTIYTCTGLLDSKRLIIKALPQV